MTVTTRADHGRIFRFDVPVDDQWHDFLLFGDPLAIACREPSRVEFWTVHYDPPTVPLRRSFIVVGTGQPLPEGWCRHWGTAVAPGGSLVWHLLERAR